jgi:hypothetical protein
MTVGAGDLVEGDAEDVIREGVERQEACVVEDEDEQRSSHRGHSWDFRIGFAELDVDLLLEAEPEDIALPLREMEKARNFFDQEVRIHFELDVKGDIGRQMLKDL